MRSPLYGQRRALRGRGEVLDIGGKTTGQIVNEVIDAGLLEEIRLPARHGPAITCLILTLVVFALSRATSTGTGVLAFRGLYAAIRDGNAPILEGGTRFVEGVLRGLTLLMAARMRSDSSCLTNVEGLVASAITMEERGRVCNGAVAESKNGKIRMEINNLLKRLKV